MPYPVSAARGHTHPQAAAGNWWEVAGQTCLAAYQAKGAASLAASYVNLANPGTYDITTSNPPTFSAETGWIFNTDAILNTNLPKLDGTQDWSGFVRESDLDVSTTYYAHVFYYHDMATTNHGFGFVKQHPSYSGSPIWYHGLGSYIDAGRAFDAEVTGVYGIAGTGAYYNGASKGTIGTATTGTPNQSYTINLGNVALFIGNIQAAAFYSTTLSGDDVSALTTAMNAL